MEKTLKEIADELGVDKQKVYRFVKKECINEAHQKNGVKQYDEAAQTAIQSHFAEKDHINEVHQNHINEAVNEALISMLQRELEIKNKQIEDLSAALVAAQQTAQAAQALHAGTIRQQLTDGGADPAEPEVPAQEKPSLFHRLFGKEK